MKNIETFEILQDNDDQGKMQEDKNDKPLNELMLRQLVHSDKILLNKIDLIKENPEAHIAKIKECISHVNKHAQLVETQYAEMDLDILLAKSREPEKPTDKRDSHALGHKILDLVNSVYINDTGPLCRNKLEMAIGELLWEGKDEYGVHVLRCKGIFKDKSDGKTYMMQGVESLFEINLVKESDEKSTLGSFLFVFTGDLKEDKLRQIVFENASKDQDKVRSNLVFK